MGPSSLKPALGPHQFQSLSATISYRQTGEPPERDLVQGAIRGRILAINSDRCFVGVARFDMSLWKELRRRNRRRTEKDN